MNLTYTLGTLSDAQQLSILGLQSYGVFEKTLGDEWQTMKSNMQDLNALQELINKAQTFICEDGESIVGMIFLVPSGNPTNIYSADQCYIRKLGVHPEYNGKGIASNLVDMCITAAKANGEHTIALHTSEFMDAARHIYENIGFSIEKEIPPIFGKRYWLYTLTL